MLTERDLQRKSLQYRKTLLRLIKACGSGHTGGDLSCLDIINVHSMNGGLGEECASLLLQEKIYARFKIVGFPIVTSTLLAIFLTKPKRPAPFSVSL
jgi:hypothetical protein